jgi:hypothetical protein
LLRLKSAESLLIGHVKGQSTLSAATAGEVMKKEAQESGPQETDELMLDQKHAHGGD